MIVLIAIVSSVLEMNAQKTSCTTDPVYRQFDFWIGEWDVYARMARKLARAK